MTKVTKGYDTAKGNTCGLFGTQGDGLVESVFSHNKDPRGDIFYPSWDGWDPTRTPLEISTGVSEIDRSCDKEK